MTLAGLCISNGSFAYTSSDVATANYLADQGIIRDMSNSTEDYKLDNTIARVEVMGMLLTMTGTTRNETCRGDYPEIKNSGQYGDWVCRTVETAADHDFIYDQMDRTRSNRRVRPYDKISRSEALALMMKAFPNDGAFAGYSYYWSSNFPTDGSNMGYKDYYSFGSIWQAAVFYDYIRKVTQDTDDLRTNPRVNAKAAIKDVLTFAKDVMENR